MQGEADALNLSMAALELLETGIVPGLSGDERFKALMALSAIRMAIREQQLSPELARTHQALVASLGVKSTEATATRIRQGDIIDRGLLHDALLKDAICRTAVTRPGLLTPSERAGIGLSEQ